MERQEESASKIMRNEGESRGKIARDVNTGEGFRNAEGRMVDSVDAVEWMDTLDDIAMHRTPVIRMKGNRKDRVVKACETQFIGGGIFLWEVPVSIRDVLILEKLKRNGEGQAQIGSRRL